MFKFCETTEKAEECFTLAQENFLSSQFGTENSEKALKAMDTTGGLYLDLVKEDHAFENKKQEFKLKAQELENEQVHELHSTVKMGLGLGGLGIVSLICAKLERTGTVFSPTAAKVIANALKFIKV